MKFLLSRASAMSIDNNPDTENDLEYKHKYTHEKRCIEINKLEDLISLIDKYGNSLIISKFEDYEDSHGQELKLKIYDNYVE